MLTRLPADSLGLVCGQLRMHDLVALSGVCRTTRDVADAALVGDFWPGHASYLDAMRIHVRRNCRKRVLLQFQRSSDPVQRRAEYRVTEPGRCVATTVWGARCKNASRCCSLCWKHQPTARFYNPFCVSRFMHKPHSLALEWDAGVPCVATRRNTDRNRRSPLAEERACLRDRRTLRAYSD